MKLFLSLALLAALSYTPTPNSPERKEILNTLREDVKQRVNLEVVFIVRYLKVHNGWAYLIVSPQSPDGKNYYEELRGVLKKGVEKWSMIAGGSCNPQCPNGSNDCADGEMVCQSTLHKRFPNAPVDIFPSQNAR